MRYQIEISTYAIHGHRMPDGQFWKYGFAGWHRIHGEVHAKKADAIAVAKKLNPATMIDTTRYLLQRPFRDMGEGWPEGGQGWMIRVYDTHTGLRAWKTVHTRFIAVDDVAKAA